METLHEDINERATGVSTMAHTGRLIVALSRRWTFRDRQFGAVFDITWKLIQSQTRSSMFCVPHTERQEELRPLGKLNVIHIDAFDTFRPNQLFGAKLNERSCAVLSVLPLLSAAPESPW